MNWPILFLLALAAARATHLVVEDLIPFGPLRDSLNKSSRTIPAYLGHGLSCTFCVSIWAGGAAAGLAQWQGWAPDGFWLFAILAFGIAQVVVLIEFLVEFLAGDDS